MSRLELWQLNVAHRPRLRRQGRGSAAGMIWTTLTTILVPANKEVEYRAGLVSGTFRARISTPVTGGTVTVLGIRPEAQKGLPNRPLLAASSG